jgi:hypothetical protein
VVPRARQWKYPNKLEEIIPASEFREKPRLCKYSKTEENHTNVLYQPYSYYNGGEELKLSQGVSQL